MVAAQIVNFRGLSAHADRTGLLKWIHSYNPKPQKVFVVHGETTVCEFFADSLSKEGYQVLAPNFETVHDLAKNEIINVGIPEETLQAEAIRAKTANGQFIGQSNGHTNGQLSGPLNGAPHIPASHTEAGPIYTSHPEISRIETGRTFLHTHPLQGKTTFNAYTRLLEAGIQLLDIIKRNESGSNGELSKFTDQITALVQKWSR